MITLLVTRIFPQIWDAVPDWPTYLGERLATKAGLDVRIMVAEEHVERVEFLSVVDPEERQRVCDAVNEIRLEYVTIAKCAHKTKGEAVPIQTPGFDVKKSMEERERAIAHAGEGAPDPWKTAAQSCVKCVCETQDRFTTDEVWRLLVNLGVRAPPEPRALGAIMRDAVHWGWCEATREMRESVRIACHRRPLRVWRSLLHVG